MKFPKLRTGPRLFLSFMLVLAVMGLIVGIAIGRLQAVNGMAEYLVNDRLAKQQQAAAWLGAVNLNGTRALSIAKSDSLEVEDYFMGRLKTGDQLTAELQATLRGDSPEEQALLSSIRQQQATYLKVRDQIFQLKAVGKTQDVERLVGAELEPALERYTGAIGALLEHQKQEAGAIARASAQVYRSSRLMLIGLGALAIGLGILFAWLLTRSIVRPLKNAVEVAQRIADGQLDADISTQRQDEIGQLLLALKAMNASLAQTIGMIGHEAEAIGDAAGQMVARNADLSQRTETQAATLQETAASIEQMTAAVAQNAEHARHARRLSESAAELAGQGGADIAEVMATMSLMKKCSAEVAQITGVIDNIAFQTNILALNAAVEAAHAGTHGQSFAVVAAEVRTLAQRSAGAAREISGLIEQLVQQIHSGDALSATAGKTMDRIVGASRQVADIVNEITMAGDQQSIGIQQANAAIGEMEQATQRNAAFVEQTAATAAGLQRQALNLKGAIGFFSVAGGIQSMPAPVVAAPLPLERAPAPPETSGDRAYRAPLDLAA